jgi:Regulator of chromosome condensation (RCC1) repeat
VHRELPAGDLLLLGGLADQRLRELGRLALLNGPADGVAAEHVEDHVEVEDRPLRRALELRDVPRPQLVRALGEQLRSLIWRVDELVAALAHAAVAGGEQPVERALRREVATLVEQCRPDLAWGDNQADELGIGIDGTEHKPQGCKNEFALSGKEIACETEPTPVKGLPASLANGETHVVQIDGGHDFTLILLSDGSVWAFGENGEGQLGTKAVKTEGSPTETRSDQAVEVELKEEANAVPATEISAGYKHAFAIAGGGQVWGWGGDGEHQLGNEAPENCKPKTAKGNACKVVPRPLGGFNAVGRTFASVAAGNSFSLASTTTGELYSVGRNEHGELGRGRTLGWLMPAKPPAPKEGETAAEKQAREEVDKKEEEEDVEEAAELAEDHEVRQVTGIAPVASLDAGNQFGVALLAAGESDPAPLLTITPEVRALRIDWTFTGEELSMRWFTYYSPCEVNRHEREGASCPIEAKSKEVKLSPQEHTYTFSGLEKIKAHRVVVTNGNRAIERRRVIWGVPLPQFPPVNTALPSISGSAHQGQTLTEVHGSWTNSPTSYAYQWLRCDSAGNNCSAIAGAEAQTYPLVSGDVGHAIRVTETASNAEASGTATSAATAEVLPSPPSNTAPPTISGTAQQGQTLSESHGSWTNNPTSYVYQWLQCNALGEIQTCVAISGATSETYVPVLGDVGHTIRVQETASNAGGSSSAATSAATAVVLPGVP